LEVTVLNQSDAVQVVVMLAVASGTAFAQAPSADEQEIRALIAASDAGKPLPMTDDAVQWSGAYKKPFSRAMSPEEIPSNQSPTRRKPGSQRTHTTPIRIEVAKSGEQGEFSAVQTPCVEKGERRVENRRWLYLSALARGRVIALTQVAS
jgi:hypothetical protein